LTLIEVCISTIVIAILFLGLAGTIRTNMTAVGSAERMARAALFLETTMESLAAQPFDNLLVMNGDRLFDADPQGAANYAADLTVFPTAVDMVQVSVVLSELRNGSELGRVTTLRTRR
jgi:Tfp pilus assembly protein PilV